MAHALVVTGSRACFARPEFCDVPVTYDVITPIAARGIFEAVHWTPAIRWRIQSIEVLHAISMAWFPDRSIAEDSGLAEESRALMLVDVAYCIHARFDLTEAAGPRDSAAQHSAMFRRRARSGRLFRSPYLGRRECRAAVALLDAAASPPSFHAGTGEVDLGWMVYDHQFDPKGRMQFFRPVMRDGVIDISSLDPARLPI